MHAMRLTPIMQADLQHTAPPITIEVAAGEQESFVLSYDAEGEFVLTPDKRSCKVPNRLAAIWSVPVTGGRGWYLVTPHDSIGINSISPLLPVARLEPGDLLWMGNRFWFVSLLSQPEVMDAPAELRDKLCPVCGSELGLVQVVQCSCGRWMHLERPDDPEAVDALNCFLAAATCGGCGRQTSLEAVLIPAVPERMTAALDDDWMDGIDPPAEAVEEPAA